MSWHPVRDARPRREGGPCGLAYPGDAASFAVAEIPLYEACGEGEHLYLTVEKRGIDTPELLRRVAGALGLGQRELGWAGRKDRHATAVQRLSAPRAAAEARLDALGDADYRVLEARPHRNKLRVGHLAGNRFALRLRGACDEAAFAADVAALRGGGLPNYFGPQRFGARGDNHEAGRALLARGGGGRRPAERFLLSAFQSACFNRVVAGRLADLGWLDAGDLAWIHAKGAVFLVADPEAERPRAAALEISATGPLPGARMLRPEGRPGEAEAARLAEAGWEDAWSRRLTGGRRPLRVPVGSLDWAREEGGLRVEFSLPPGSYASTLLAELGVFHPQAEEAGCPT